MAQQYVFRGERVPFAADPADQRAREQSKREAEKLVTQKPPAADDVLADEVEVERRVGDYQVGGLDAFGTTASPPTWDDVLEGHEQPHAPPQDDRPSDARAEVT